MKYISTRGASPALSFTDIITSGLAPDGGLYMPENIPAFSLKQIKGWKGLAYPELAYEIMAPFIDGEIPEKDLKLLLKESYAGFREPNIAPVKKLKKDEYLLELFHGPTLAFKDFALQFLGRLLEYTLKKNHQEVVVIGATSGDTGSAAIEGLKYSDRIKMFILHPHNRTSDIQRRQMTTVASPNVFNLAVEGHFDDCQELVKIMFASPDFLKGKKLVAVNSINWVRIMAQIVYYFYSFLQLEEEAVSFAVPTGNFGDIFAGYIASRMGLPVKKLIVATNENDILDRFFQANDYSKQGVNATLSPSMDIQISSNFERLLFEMHNRDGAAVSALMKNFGATGKLKVAADIHAKMRELFDSCSASDKDIIATMQAVFKETKEVIDPHTAAGVFAARQKCVTPVITLATADPVKFPAALEQAGIKEKHLPDYLAHLFSAPERFTVLPNDLSTVQAFIQKHAG